MSYQAITRRALGAALSDWTLQDGGTWCMVTPQQAELREQGWKLHVSATVASAPSVLAGAAAVLGASPCAFKFAVSPRVTAELTAVRASRAQSGKFLTVYPADDEQLRELAERLHRATAGLAGPAIRSDRRYRPGSLVHYRYGGFARPRELDDEGFYTGLLRAPDGSSVPDLRNPWFSPPSWAEPPFPAPARTTRRPGDPVLLAGRYEVREAIRHANRGGVYRARDRHSDTDVLLKEARPHIGASPDGTDARDLLRYEAAVLARLGPAGLTPRPHEVFEAGGHLFLAEELIEGVSLHRWSADRAEEHGGLMPVVELRRLARSLTALLARVHAAGYVLRDLKPTNVMITPAGRPVLIDPECALAADATAHAAGTRGFTDPAHLDDIRALAPDGTPRRIPAPGPAADCFSLGATLLHAASGINPVLAPDSAPARPAGERIAAMVAAARPGCPALDDLAPLVLGLTADGPARWTLPRAAAYLAAPAAVPRTTAGTPPDPGTTAAAARLLRDGLDHLADTLDPAGEHLWPPPRSLPPGDPCNVQLGAAGVLAVLDRAARAGAGPAGAGPAVEAALVTGARWLARQLDRPGRILPGLYFGRSGTAWALYDAAVTLDEPALAARARDYALGIPLDWHNPDVCHGLAGAGLAQLHLWRRTGDPRFAERAGRCADGVLARTAEPGGVDWPLGPGHRRDLAGCTSYGFGHGVAGVGAFLLAAGTALQRPELVEIAAAGGHALCALAERRGGAAVWPKGPGRTERTGLDFWCNGASGIGTFLVPLWQVTGEPVFREHAELAARAVRLDRWRLGPSACHGVAGNAHLLLDLAEATGEERYRAWAGEAVTCLAVRAARREGRLLVPDETLREVHASYQVGLAGVLDLLLRLVHGGGRSWLPGTTGPPAAASPLPGPEGRR
ncbi:class IV lanthionine synthetase LanL [Streptomyces sp. NPDC089919]|uniref:class IV lanthionine synthetase LanL n=1 Tax=Streptomyces sp. NPDC089919 TaxID=3155188 RepID=UPI00343C8A95